jgi:ABC-type multidrug transport system fused ATPase/permease subunit
MAQGYIFFVNNNSAKLLQGITGDAAAANNILSCMFTLATKLLTILTIGIFMIIQEPFIAFFLLVLAGLCVLTIQLFYKNSMNKYGQLQREAVWENNQACYEAIQGSKEVLVTGRQEYFKKRYVKSISDWNKYCIKIEMATTIPAYIIETVCVIGLLLAVGIQVGVNGVSAEMVTGLSMIAVSAFRILPAVGSVSSSLNGIRSYIPSFNATYETIKKVNELEEEIRKNEKKYAAEQYESIRLKEELSVNHIYYKYPATDCYILEDVNLKIKVKSSIGIIGASGAGKSTFVDVLLGLLKPEKGQIMMDGIDITRLGNNWNQNIGYVPQSIYLIDEDIRSNIAFGIAKEDIDDDMVWRALRMAQLADFVEQQPKGLDTEVGEWGIKFSGGQRQRVAIARALYFNPEILVWDEATAALDNETEKALMESIDALLGEKTLIIVAHRLTTIQQCDYIYEVANGKLVPREKEEVFGA